MPQMALVGLDGFSLSWKVGAVLFQRRFDCVVRAVDWNDACAQLALICATRKCKEIQYWVGVMRSMFVALAFQTIEQGHAHERRSDHWKRLANGQLVEVA